MADNPAPNPGWKNQGPGASKKDVPPVAGWKKNAAGAAEPAQGKGPRAWQNQGPTSSPQKGLSRGGKLAIATLLLALLAGGTVAWLLYIRPLKPACLVLVGASYDINLAIPHNAYGWQGLKDLAAQADKVGCRLVYPPGEPVELQGAKSWNELWQREIPKVESNEPTVVVWLALHGGADNNGAYLFLNDPRGQEKIYLQEILDKLPKQWPGKRILLILEPAQVAAHWTSGMLQNHFVRELNKLSGVIKDNDNLVVLCASDENQLCWPSEEWRQTIFGHYLIEGLRGAGHSGSNQRLTAADLHKYVAAKVAGWVQTNRGARQTPILFPRDGRRAQDMELVQTGDSYTERIPADAPGRKFTPSPELKDTWVQCAGLGRQVPHPAVYTPDLWRVYRDSLVRWEQLERAGTDVRRIAILKDRCSACAAEIPRKARVDLPNRDITRESTRALPLPAVLGLTPSPAVTSNLKDDLVSKLWQAKSEERGKILQAALNGANVAAELQGEQGKLFYDQLCRSLLKFLSDRTSFNPGDLVPVTPDGESKARALVHLLDDRFKLPRPAEVNYLVMLLKDIDPKTPPPEKLMQKALAVRLLAEEAALAVPASADAAPHSESVFAWVKPKIDDADKNRRLGEDWLFGAGDQEWQTAQQYLDKAAKDYQIALEDAAIVRKGIDLRDRVLADLPYFAEWLARRRLTRDAAQVKEMGDLVAQVKDLSDDVGQLSWFLEQSKFKGQGFHQDQGRSEHNPDGLEPRALLDNLAAKVDTEYQNPLSGLLNRFKRNCQKLDKEVHRPVLWHDIEAALAVPLVEGEAGDQDAALRMSLLKNSRSISGNLQEDKDKFAQEESDGGGRAELDGWHQKLALAATVLLGQEKYPLAGGFTPAKLGEYWQALPGQTATNLKESCQDTDLSKVTLQIREAAYLSRLLPGGLMPNWASDEVPYGPAEGLRQLRLHDLLLWQGHRARDDYWYDETGDPYYLKSAQAYARMAKDLSVAGTNEVINAARAKNAVAFADSVKKWAVAILAPGKVNWTSEEILSLKWKIVADAPVPAGVPMYWLNIQGAETLDSTKRQPAKDWLPAEVLYRLKKLPGEKAKATLTCMYRGQIIPNAVSPELGKAEVIVNHFPPDKAGLAYREDKDFDYGAIAIVLDCTPTMDYYKINGISRFEHAIRALDVMLKSVPKNTFVSLMAFIDWVGDRNQTDVNTQYYFVRAPERWQESQRMELIAKVRREFKDTDKFSGFSPIAKAIMASRDRGFPGGGYNGPKLIVVLTDGDDNISFEDHYVGTRDQAKMAAHNRRVRLKMRDEFDGKGIAIHIVCFNEAKDKENKEEIARAKQQFDVVEQVDPSGSFRLQPDPNKLAEELVDAIRPKLRLQKGGQRVPGFPDEGKVVLDTLQWGPGLEPGEYTVKVQSKQDVNLRPGDNLILTLKRDGPKVFFEHSLYAPEESDNLVKGGKAIKAGELISVLRNYVNKKTNSVHQLITMEENRGGGRGGFIQQQAPGFTWLEVKPKDTQPPGLITWQRDFSYPAPAIAADIQNWPRQAGKEVAVDSSLWWAPSSDNPAFSRFVDINLQGTRLVGSNRDFRVGNASMRIEEVTMEDVEVGSGPGGRRSEKKKCLVVRVSHEPKKPVYVQLQSQDSVQTPAEEHRFYSSANQYTALFWNLPNTKQSHFTLNLISLDDFKKVSMAAGRSITFELPPPDGKIGPDPIVHTDSP